MAVDVHLGMSPEMVTVVEGASANMATSAASEVGWMEGKTGPCAGFNVDVAGQDMNTRLEMSRESSEVECLNSQGQRKWLRLNRPGN